MHVQDPVADWKVAMKMLNSTAYVPNMVVKVCTTSSGRGMGTLILVQFIDGAHWVHLENPDPVNMAIREWLRTLSARPTGHLGDEL
jgi:soluble epoxide hydrolase/lipid-phosphate phosphatase